MGTIASGQRWRGGGVAAGPSGSNYRLLPVFKVSNFPSLQSALLAVMSNQHQQICGRKRRICALSSALTQEMKEG